ncbi:hypothetical protein HAX54_009146, partial [Datura stramonium]|nr:hypothetical protein [Datura stramonium]
GKHAMGVGSKKSAETRLRCKKMSLETNRWYIERVVPGGRGIRSREMTTPSFQKWLTPTTHLISQRSILFDRRLESSNYARKGTLQRIGRLDRTFKGRAILCAHTRKSCNNATEGLQKWMKPMAHMFSQ